MGQARPRRPSDFPLELAAHEILVWTSGIVGAIREGKTSMVQSIIGSGRGQGRQTMDDALAALLAAGTIDAREAYLNASDKQRFRPGARAASPESSSGAGAA